MYTAHYFHENVFVGLINISKIITKNQRIIKSQNGLSKKESESWPSYSTLSCAGCHPPDQGMLGPCSILTSNAYRNGSSIASLGSLCQDLMLWINVFFLIPSFLCAPLKYWKSAMRSPQSFLFSKLNKPSSLSLSLYERCSSPMTGAPALWSSSWCPQDPLYQLYIFLMLGTPDLDTVL